MELHDETILPDLPGFVITRLDSGTLKVKARPCTGNMVETWRSLRTLSDRADLMVGEIDLSELPITLEGRRYHTDIAHQIVPFLCRDQLVRIALPPEVIHEVRGVCRGIVVESFRGAVGADIELSCTSRACVPFPVRQCVMTEELLNKIMPPAPVSLQDTHATLGVLRDVLTRNEIPYVLGNAIVRASRHLRKLRRYKRAELKKPCSTNPTVNNDDPMLTDSDTDCDDCPNVDIPPTTKPTSTPTRLPKIGRDKPVNGNVLACLGTTIHCYVCKKRYCFPKKIKKVDVAWGQYPKLCHCCAVYNYRKRHQRTDLTGKYAVVTGGRIKIGYYIVLKLLRDGAHVIVTTRFPRDAAKRFHQENDFNAFKDRLKIYPLEMKSLSAVYAFIEYVHKTFPQLDILINNAAQTISRPVNFYQHLLSYETAELSSIPAECSQLLATTEVLDYYGANGTHMGVGEHAKKIKPNAGVTGVRANTKKPSAVLNDVRGQTGKLHGDMTGEPPAIMVQTNYKLPSPLATCGTHNDHQGKHFRACSDDSDMDSDDYTCKRSKTQHKDDGGDATPSFTDVTESDAIDMESAQTAIVCTASAIKSQATTPTGLSTILESEKTASASVSTYFPPGELDADGQQLDLRPMNTWRLPIEDVSLAELLEVLAINAVAPFILDQSLKPLLDKSPCRRRFIVNVSAMEGQFNRTHKNHFHPHTNMAKAALNMLTRTAAVGYRESGVYMTAVDTGWVTDERPFPQAKHEEEKGFILPLDIVDGAARVYDPIVCGLNNPEEPYCALFLKDYTPYPW